MGCMVALQWRQFTGVRGVRRLAKLEAADPSGSAKVSTGSGRIVTRGVPGPGCVQSAQTAEVRVLGRHRGLGLLTGHGEAAVEGVQGGLPARGPAGLASAGEAERRDPHVEPFQGGGLVREVSEGFDRPS